MRSLAAAYALLVALAMPAMLWAAEDAPPVAPTPSATTPTTSAPAPPAPDTPVSSEDGTASPDGATTSPAAPAGSPAPTAPGAAGSPDVSPDAAKAARAAGKAAADDDPQPVARTAASGRVTIEDFSFVPRTITVDEGDTVTWTNRDGVGHTATAEDGSFDTGMLAQGESGSHTFENAGTYRYQCTPHPNMTGTVVVRAAGGGGGAGDDDATGEPVGDDTASEAGTGSSSSGSSGSSLPATGPHVGAVFLGGVLLLGAGALLRRRLDA